MVFFFVLISFIAGIAIISLVELFRPNSPDKQDIADTIIKKYKDNYGDNWKNKLEEDYKAYSNNQH